MPAPLSHHPDHGPSSPRGPARRAAPLGELRTELGRRIALARQPHPEGVTAPRLSLLLAELGTMAEVWSAAAKTRKVQHVPATQHRAVMLLPGFGTHPARMGRMRRTLEQAGHRVSDWGLGFNMGADEDRLARLVSRIEAMARREREPLVLVGWSLGGLYAREAAKLTPDAVGMVITLGSPFSGDLRANHAWRAYQAIAGHAVVDAPMAADLGTKPPVPTIALWSVRDGIVGPRAACGRPHERDTAVAMRCTHLGFASHPAVIAEVRRQIETRA
jgi:pimeloyl-ACP methyl ester carboxylesterase